MEPLAGAELKGDDRQRDRQHQTADELFDPGRRQMVLHHRQDEDPDGKEPDVRGCGAGCARFCRECPGGIW